MDKKIAKILSELQNGFKLEARPFKRIANEVDSTEEEVIDIISRCCDEGIVRRIGVAIKPEKTGFVANALTAWKVPEDKVHEIGAEMAEMREISHCYDRNCPLGWDYNLFTMIHGQSQENLDKIIKNISERFGLTEYKVMKTLRELKKTSMKYEF